MSNKNTVSGRVGKVYRLTPTRARQEHQNPSRPRRDETTDKEKGQSTMSTSHVDERRRTYSVNEAAEVLGISRSTAYACVKSGEIPSLRFRRRIVIPAHVIEQLISSVDLSVGA